VDGDHPFVGERDDAGRLEAREDRLDLLERRARRIHHQVLPTPSRRDRLEHRGQVSDGFRATAPGLVGGHEDRLAREEHAQGPEPVHDEGRAGGHEVDDAVGETHPWSDLDRPGEGHDLRRDPPFGQGPRGRPRVARGEPKPRQVLECSLRRV
jgi:hypothetical protein